MQCTHLQNIQPVEPQSEGCVECLRQGDDWVQLRMCLTCGYIGCCDSSRNRHATRHFKDTGHPAIQAVGDAGGWKWCYVDQVMER